MNAPARSITCQVYVAWWLRWYIAGVALMSALTGLEPDMQKVEFWAGRAVRVREVR